MRIGVDIDDVLYPFTRIFRIFYHAQVGRDFDLEAMTSYKLWESLGITKQETLKIIDHLFNFSFFEKALPIANSQNAIRSLAVNNEILAITARPSHINEVTKKWVKKHFGDSIKEVICTGEFYNVTPKRKSDICYEKGINLLIEDNAFYAFECAENGIKVILFDKPWNKLSNHSYLSHPSITRVYSWEAAIEAINEILSVENLAIFK